MQQVGWIGTGIMGKSMCQLLLTAGFNLNIYNRTRSKTDDLVTKGAQFLSPKELAQQSDVVILMVGVPGDVESLLFSEEFDVLNNMRKGSILIDHTTNSPTLAKKIARIAEQKGIFSLDAPVSGGDIGAQQGKLVIMVGGNVQAFQSVTPIFKTYAKSYILQGEEPGSGQHCKMANQIAIATQLLGMVESLIYAKKANLNLEKVLENISGGAAWSFSLSNFAPKIIKGDLQPGGQIYYFMKDLRIALEECEKMNLCLPGLALVKQLYQAVVAEGGDKLGMQALIKALEMINSIQI